MSRSRRSPATTTLIGVSTRGGPGSTRTAESVRRSLESTILMKQLLEMGFTPSQLQAGGAPLEACRHFWQGKCIRAKADSTCNFAHGTRADAKRILCRHTQIRGACRYGDARHYATQAEYDALDWDARVPLDAVGPHAPPTTMESPKGPHAEGGSESLV